MIRKNGKRNKYKDEISKNIDDEIKKVHSNCKDFDLNTIKNNSETVYKALKNIETQYTCNKNCRVSQKILDKAPTIQAFIKEFINAQTDFIDCVKNQITEDIKIFFSLQELEKSNSELWQAMKYYHAIKILRNSINHVSGGMGDMNKTMQAYLEEKGLGDTAIGAGETFKFKLEKKFISDTLQDAIDFSREVCKN